MRENSQATAQETQEIEDMKETQSSSSNSGSQKMSGMVKSRVHPDVVSYSAAITACSYAGQRGLALSLLNQMRKEGVAPNVRF